MTSLKKDFDRWLGEFKDSIASYDYYADLNKALVRADKWKPELCLMNSLLGSHNIEQDFINLCNKYPDVLQTIPILLAVRKRNIPILEGGVSLTYNFGKKGPRNTLQEYADFMRGTGLFDFIETHAVNNLYDYVTGVEVGLDSNGRKNRGGHLMENLVESYLMRMGLIRREKEGKNPLKGNPSENGIYYKELYTSQAQQFWGVDLSPITNGGTVEKRFDFVVRANDEIYGIETNFYNAGGSKLNETARSYKEMAEESENIKGFTFVWVTDGKGWTDARNNLHETFDVMNQIYNLAELERGAFKQLFAR